MAKVSKEEANYRQPTPDWDRRCDHCTMFLEPNLCSVVEGYVQPNGVNPRWQRGEWVVRARKTGAMVGIMRLAIAPAPRVYRFFRLRGLQPLWTPVEPLTPLPVETVEVTLDWDTGVMWIERAGDLHGVSGFEWL